MQVSLVSLACSMSEIISTMVDESNKTDRFLLNYCESEKAWLRQDSSFTESSVRLGLRLVCLYQKNTAVISETLNLKI